MDCYWYRRLGGVDYAQHAIISSPWTFHFRQKLKIELYLGVPQEFPQLRGCLHEGRKILVPGRSQKVDHPSAIYFMYSVYMQRVVLVRRAGIFLVLGSSQLTGGKILVLGRSQHHVNCLLQEDRSTRDKPDKHSGGSFSG